MVEQWKLFEIGEVGKYNPQLLLWLPFLIYKNDIVNVKGNKSLGTRVNDPALSLKWYVQIKKISNFESSELLLTVKQRALL